MSVIYNNNSNPETVIFNSSGTSVEPEIIKYNYGNDEIWKKIKNVSAILGTDSGDRIITITNGAAFPITLASKINIGTVRFRTYWPVNDQGEPYDASHDVPPGYGKYVNQTIIGGLASYTGFQLTGTQNVVPGSVDIKAVPGESYSINIKYTVDNTSLTAQIWFKTYYDNSYTVYIEPPQVTLQPGNSTTASLVYDKGGVTYNLTNDDTWTLGTLKTFVCNAATNNDICVNAPYQIPLA